MQTKTNQPEQNDTIYFNEQDKKPQFNLENYLESPNQSPWLSAPMAINQYLNQPIISTPLFIHGPAGSGKTHLAHAIAYAMHNNGMDRILILNAETYVNTTIFSIRNGTNGAFRSSVHSANAFIVDDVEYIRGKEKSQANLIHAFKELQLQHRPIILTSSLTLSEFNNLGSQLRQVIASATVITIPYPDLTTKITLIERMFAAAHTSIDTETIQFLASHINSIPELQGVVSTLTHNLKSCVTITTDIAEKILKQRMKLAAITTPGT